MADAATFDQQTLIVSVGRRPPAFDPPNLLGTTLAPTSAAAPFAQLQWPNPRRQVLGTPGWIFQGVIVDEELLPFRTEWRNPARRTAVLAFDAPNLLTTTLAAAPATLPFRLSDWTMPRGKTAPTLSIATGRPFYYDEGKPPHQDQWPTPPRLRTPITFEPPNLLHGPLTPPIVVMPFVQSEWPVVFPVRRPTLTIAQPRPAYYDEGKPPHQDDWMVPARARRTATFEAVNLLQGTLDPSGTLAPFALLDWVLPRATRGSGRPQVWSQNRPFFYEDAPPPVEVYLIVFGAEALQPPSRVDDEGLE